MTSYAYDPAPRHLIAVWGCGIGACASVVARCASGTPVADVRHLAEALTRLSSTAWSGYTDPGAVEPAPTTSVLEAVRDPHLPFDGLLYVESDPLLQRAHEVGRRLVAVGGAGVRRAVLDDVVVELDAVDRALLGDLDGRARQAVELTRLDVSPLQIAAADRLLAAVPMGDERLFSEVEPAAAAVAAAHWCLAAADVVLARGEWIGLDDLVDAADDAEPLDAEPLDVETPRAALRLMRDGASPLAVVRCLVEPALLAGRGLLLAGDEMLRTLLDPTDPSRCLLRRLTRMIQVFCGLFETTYSTGGEDTLWDPDRSEALRQEFDRAVRAEAARTATRLLDTTPVAAAPS